MTSSCGERINPVTKKAELHNGIDIAVEENTKVKAVRSGVVTEAGFDNFNGNFVRYQTEDGYKIVYAHLNKVLVEKDDQIKQGDIIALSGNTGISTGPHLHYTVWKQEMLINPTQFVNLKYTQDVVEEYAKRGVALKSEQN